MFGFIRKFLKYGILNIYDCRYVIKTLQRILKKTCMFRLLPTFLLTFLVSIVVGQIPEWQKELPLCMFVSAENLVSVRLNGALAEDIQVKATGAQVQQRNDSTFQITPTQFQDDIRVKLYFKNILCGVKQFPVRYLPDIDIVFPGENNGVVKKKDLLAVQQIFATSTKNLEELGLSPNLKYYSVVISDQRNVTIFSEQVQQYGVSDKLKNILLNTKSGMTLRITNIRLEGLNGFSYPVYYSKAWFVTE